MGKASRIKRDRRLPDGPMCDFCGLLPLYRFPTRNFTYSIIGKPAVDYFGWDACESCAKMVDSRDWDRLVVRGVSFYRRRMGGSGFENELYTILGQLYRLMDANRIGPKEPLNVDGS